MTPITDPHLAVLIERTKHTARVVDELKAMFVDVPMLRKDQEHHADVLKQVSLLVSSMGASLHQMDKRVLVLEKWNKGLIWFSTVAMSTVVGVAGYAANFFNTLDATGQTTDRRITTLEYIINSPHFERAVAKEGPVATGSK